MIENWVTFKASFDDTINHNALINWNNYQRLVCVHDRKLGNFKASFDVTINHLNALINLNNYQRGVVVTD